MKVRRIISIAALTLAGLIALAVLAVWLLAGASPSAYRPVQLSLDQRRGAAREFFYTRILGEFNDKVQLNDPFAWTISQDEINAWLASMPEIAQIIPGGDPGRVYDAMEAAGIGEPAAAIAPGRLTLMARQKDYNKIVSLDLSLSTGPDGRLNVKLLGTRVGVVDVPDSVFHSRLENIKSQMKGIARTDAQTGRDAEPQQGLSGGHIGRTLAALIAAIDEEPIDTEIRWPLGQQKYFRVQSIEFGEGKITFRVQPTRRPGQTR
ncbi:MAG: hypothetical protein HZA50_05295 [Planctomycetes bacterium]|nr:hypothetical protein [Planctomycetota bacterium]